MSMFPDGKELPDTFDDWHSQALEAYDKLTGEGLVVEKALIDPATFPDWCWANGMKMDTSGRTRYATEWVEKKHKVDSDGLET